MDYKFVFIPVLGGEGAFEQEFEALEIIEKYYGDGRAKRSHVPFINHIYEGLEILNRLCVSNTVKDAYAIHPIVQAGKEWEEVRKLCCYDLACEYRDYANAYLCREETDHIETTDDVHNHLLKLVGKPMSKNCSFMLFADKLQNKKDFLLYHYPNHTRSKELLKYFDLWTSYLVRQSV